MNNEQDIMKESIILKTLDQIKVLSHPLRMKILEALSRKPMTTMQVADKLGEKPTGLYHHVNLLEKAGFIKLIDTRKKRGTVEKYYKTVARRFSIDRKLLELSSSAREAIGGLQEMVLGFLNDTASEIQKSIADNLIDKDDEKSKAYIWRTHIRGSREKIDKLKKEFEKLIEKCDEVDSEDGEFEYGFTLLFYPISEEGKGKKRKK